MNHSDCDGEYWDAQGLACSLHIRLPSRQHMQKVLRVSAMGWHYAGLHKHGTRSDCQRDEAFRNAKMGCQGVCVAICIKGGDGAFDCGHEGQCCRERRWWRRRP